MSWRIKGQSEIQCGDFKGDRVDNALGLRLLHQASLGSNS